MDEPAPTELTDDLASSAIESGRAATATRPSTPDPEPVASPRHDRPALTWIAVAALLAVAATSLVAWRAMGDRENRQTDGLLLGAPANVLGYDYDRPGNTIWLSISGPRASTLNGDLYTAGCASDAVRSPTRPTCSSPNPTFDSRGHLYAVRVLKAESQRPLVIALADPHLATKGAAAVQNCRPAGPPLVPAMCPADMAGDAGLTTTFIVRAPDTTPQDPTDNPAICAATFGDEATEEGGEKLPQPWVRLCEIPAAQVRQGDYIVQARTNADQSSPRLSRNAGLQPGTGAGSLERADPGAAGDGQNHFALRAEWEGGPDENRGSGVYVGALNHLVVFVNQASSRVSFQLTHLPTTAAGHTLRLKMFDLGDVPSAANATTSRAPTGLDVRVVPPLAARVDGNPLREFTGCSFAFLDSPTLTTTEVTGAVAERCGVDGVSQTDINGKVAVVDVPVPAGYTCDRTFTDCWISLQLTYRGSPNDTTSWSAELIGGDPPPAATPTTTHADPGGR